ncbi:hypothetical protein M1585_04825 [Candidatus Parvarchaeota archaeon]|nr:hypothetical protein [Candidatus Parvarchaeota archaeon]
MKHNTTKQRKRKNNKIISNINYYNIIAASIFSVLLLVVSPFIYAKVVGDTLSLIIFLCEIIIFFPFLIAYQYITRNPQYILLIIWAVLFTLAIIPTAISPVGSYNHALFRGITLVGTMFLDMYLTIMIFLKGKLIYKIIFPIAFLALTGFAVFIFQVAWTGRISFTELWIYHNLIFPIFHTPNN